MINNTTEIVETVSSSVPILVKGFLFLLYSLFTVILGWKLSNRTADRPYLTNEIYSPIYEDIKRRGINISNFKKSDSEIINLKKTLEDNGKYYLVPKKLREEIDSYYDTCEEYNNKLNNAIKEITDICINEVRKIKTEEDHERFTNRINEANKVANRSRRRKLLGLTHILPFRYLLEGKSYKLPQLDDYTTYLLTQNYEKWDSKITKDDLERNSISLEKLVSQLFELVGQNDDVIRFKQLQNELKNPEKLLNKIQKRIKNPTPIVEKLGI